MEDTDDEMATLVPFGMVKINVDCEGSALAGIYSLARLPLRDSTNKI